jgi:ribonuclease BN (tRNA processing enzyme)
MTRIFCYAGCLMLLAGVTLAVQQTGGRGAAGPAPAGARGRGAESSDKTSILVLGVGTPAMSAERSGTSIGVIVRGTIYIFDAGPGIERRMFEARARANNGIQRIGPVFITHLHSDHTLGLPAMLYHVRDPRTPFTVYGPPGLKNMMTHIVAAWQEDRDVRVNGLQHSAPVGWETDVHEVTSGVVFKDANITVKTFEVSHGSWQHALGYRIDTPDRSIVISGDTRPTDAIVQACDGCDVLVHEAIFEAAVSPEYNKEYHTTPAQLGEIAARSKAGMVVIYHHAPATIPPSEFVRAVLANYHGPVMFARDLDTY